jgi:hypothetical protein
MSAIRILHNYPSSLCKIDHFFPLLIAHHHVLKAKKSTLTQVQAPLAQPVEAPPREKCELSTGLRRTEPHRDRRLVATD